MNRLLCVLGVLMVTLRPAIAAADVLPIKPLPARAREHLGGVPARIYEAAQKQARYLRGSVRPWQRDGPMLFREEPVAMTDVTTSQVATGLIGVLNNARWVYERGRREVRFDDRTFTVPALSGKPLPVAAAQRIAIDGVLLIESPKPLALHYTPATAPDRGRATDRLYLNHHDGERAWKTGQAIAAWEATLRVGAGE